MVGTGPRGWGGPRLVAAVVGVALVLVVWLLGTPPGGTPDEQAHLIRGMSAAEGQWHGRAPSPPGPASNLAAEVTRSFTLPARLNLLDKAPCYVQTTKTAADCPTLFTLIHGRARSHVGAYFPLAYVPLGLAELSASNPAAADYYGRAVSAGWCLALLGLGFACTRRRRERIAWFAGFLPITAFAATAAATNGIEVCGALALAAGALGVHRDRGRAGAWAVVAGGISLAIAKDGGPFFLAAEAVLLTLAARGLSWIPRLGPARIGAWAAPVAGAVANLVWTVFFGRNPVTGTQTPLSSSRLHHEVWQALGGFPRQVFTQFGWADTYVPDWVVILGWTCAGVVLLLLALRARVRGVLVAVLGLVVVFLATTAFAVIEIRGSFGLQGRYTLAAIVPLALYACLAERRPDRTPGALLRAGGAVLGLAATGLVVLTGMSALTNLRRNAVGPNGSWRLADASWAGPGGNTLLLALLAAACAVLLVTVLAGRDPRQKAPIDPRTPG